MGWNDVSNGNSGNGEGKNKVKFVEMKENNVVQLRALDEAPYSRYTHWIPQANGGKGATIDCIGRNCPVCEDRNAKKASGAPQKYSVRKQHAMNVLNRGTGEVEVLDKGKRCYEALASIRDMIGDLRGYDVKIKVTGADTDTSYTPVPMPAKALTDAEKNLDKYNFTELYPKLTREQVLMFMEGKGWVDVMGGNNTDGASGSEDELPDIDFSKASGQ